jgi:hypothetical protein
MSTERTLETLQQEYTQLAVKAGHLQFQIFGLNKELVLVNNLLQDLNLEAAKKQAEAPKAVENA